VVNNSLPNLESNSARKQFPSDFVDFCKRRPTRTKDKFQLAFEKVLRKDHTLKENSLSNRLAEEAENVLLNLINDYTQDSLKSKESPKNEQMRSKGTKFGDSVTSSMELVPLPGNSRVHNDSGLSHLEVEEELQETFMPDYAEPEWSGMFDFSWDGTHHQDIMDEIAQIDSRQDFHISTTRPQEERQIQPNREKSLRSATSDDLWNQEQDDMESSVFLKDECARTANTETPSFSGNGPLMDFLNETHDEMMLPRWRHSKSSGN
jgi:hypothetical protein